MADLSDVDRYARQVAPELPNRRGDAQPSIKLDGNSGEASFVCDRDDSFDTILASFFPDVPCEVLHVKELRAWGKPEDHQQYVKVGIRLTDPNGIRHDTAELRKRIRSHRPHRHVGTGAPRDVNVVLSDWQVGKAGEAGGGTPELIDRLNRQLDKTLDYLDALKRDGGYDRIRILKGGDIVDQCFGFGPEGKQLWTNDRNLAEQMGDAQELDIKWHKTLARHCDRLDSYAVASNHGQPRNNGQQPTDDSDSYDLVLHRWTGSVLAENPDAYGHVNVLQPQDPLVAYADSHGYRIGLTHSHQAKGGGKPIYKVWEWWKGQEFARLVDVDLMVAGHHHHPFLIEQAGHTLMGAPANDGGSRWLTSVTGEWAKAGTLVFTTSAEGWDNYRILT